MAILEEWGGGGDMQTIMKSIIIALIYIAGQGSLSCRPRPVCWQFAILISPLSIIHVLPTLTSVYSD